MKNNMCLISSLVSGLCLLTKKFIIALFANAIVKMLLIWLIVAFDTISSKRVQFLLDTWSIVYSFNFELKEMRKPTLLHYWRFSKFVLYL